MQAVASKSINPPKAVAQGCPPSFFNRMGGTTSASSASANPIICYHHHGLSSVITLSDENGAIVERYRYTAFGAVTIRDAAGNTINTSAHGNRFLYTGREYFQGVNLYDYRNRVYSPTLGRFLQTDPIGFDAGDINWYRYVRNSVVNYVDPMGLSCQITVNVKHWGDIKGQDNKNTIHVGCGANKANEGGIGEGAYKNNYKHPGHPGCGQFDEDDYLPEDLVYEAVDAALKKAEAEAKKRCKDPKLCCKNVKIKIDCGKDQKKWEKQYRTSGKNKCDTTVTIPCK